MEAGCMPGWRKVGEAVGEGYVAEDGGVEMLWKVGKCLVGCKSLHRQMALDIHT